MQTHFLNGTLVSETDLLISPRDVGFSRGYAVFDFLKTYAHHRPFKLVEHIDRLFNSARLVHLAIPWSKEEVSGWVLKTLAANPSDEEKFIKIMISGGISNTLLPANDPTIVILVDPCVIYPQEYYEKGVGVIMVKHKRYLPEAKTNNYIEGMTQTQIAKQTGAIEPVYYSDAQVFEACASNIFAVIDGKLVTPKTHILSGITRSVLLEILQLNIPIEVRDFSKNELMQATEVFLTASGKEVVPVTTIDGKPVGDGRVGDISNDVMRQFRNYTRSGKW